MIAIVNILTTIISSIICVWASYRYIKRIDARNEFDSRVYTDVQGPKKLQDTIGVALLVLAVVVRAIKIGQLPDALNQDSAFAAVSAYSLMEHHYDINGVRFPVMFSALNNSQMNVLLSLLMIPFIKLMGYNNLAIVMPNLILNIIGLVSGYYLMRKVFGVGPAIAYAAVAVCNPWSYIQSRWALESNIFPHCFILCVLVLFIAVTKNIKALLYLSTFMFGIAHYCYGVSLYVIPVFLLTVFIWLLRQHKISIINLILSVLFYLFSSWPFFLTIIVNMFQLPSIETPLFTIPYFPNGARQGDILITGKDPLHQLFRNLYSICKVLILQRDELIWSYVPGFGTMMLYMVPFMICGIVLLFHGRKIKSNFEHQFMNCILVTWFAVILIAGVMTRDTNSTRLNIALPFCLIMSGLGVYFACTMLRRAIVVVASIMTGMSGIFLLDYFTVYQERFFDAEYAYSGNFVKTLEKAHSYNAEKYVITPDSQYPGSKDVSEIDTLYVWKIDTDYRLGITNEGFGDGQLSYSERFQYVNAPQIKTIDSDNTVYVETTEYAEYFSSDDFDLYNYQEFFVAVPKTLNQE